MERSFAIKAEVRELDAGIFVFPAQKTMYGGKSIAVGDRVFLFASENSGGRGLFARGTVIAAEALPKTAAVRQTPRVSIAVRRDSRARLPLGRAELRGFRDGSGDVPEVELDFKLYRQATDKVIGLSAGAAALLDRLF